MPVSKPVWKRVVPLVVVVVVALGSAATVMERTFWAIWLAESFAWVVKVKVPLWDGVPEIVPVACKVRPGGSDPPPFTRAQP